MFFLGGFLGADECSIPFTPTPVESNNVVELSGASFDGFYISKNIDAVPTSLPSDWDFDTIMLANFNDNTAEAGNYAWNLKNTSHLLVRKRIKNEYDWQTVAVHPISELKDFDFDGIDIATENNDYEYAIFSYLNGAEGKYTSSYVSSENNELVIADKTGIYTTILTDGYCDTTDQAPNATVTTLYGKYPTIIRNTDAQYEEIAVTATFLPLKTESGECIDANEATEDDRTRILYQRKLKNFLSNGLPKILKNVDGQAWLVYITTPPSDNADSAYNDRKLTFTCTEIGSIHSEKDLYEAGISDVPEEWWFQS